jgi:hypothetical protein
MNVQLSAGLTWDTLPKARVVTMVRLDLVRDLVDMVGLDCVEAETLDTLDALKQELDLLEAGND